MDTYLSCTGCHIQSTIFLFYTRNIYCTNDQLFQIAQKFTPPTAHIQQITTQFSADNNKLERERERRTKVSEKRERDKDKERQRQRHTGRQTERASEDMLMSYWGHDWKHLITHNMSLDGWNKQWDKQKEDIYKHSVYLKQMNKNCYRDKNVHSKLGLCYNAQHLSSNASLPPNIRITL